MKHTNKLSEPFDHDRYERDSEWLPAAIAVTLMIAGCAVFYAGLVVVASLV